jgi:hypothetical protein
MDTMMPRTPGVRIGFRTTERGRRLLRPPASLLPANRVLDVLHRQLVTRARAVDAMRIDTPLTENSTGGAEDDTRRT